MINYLAAPYSSCDHRIRERRYEQICFVTAQLIIRGEIIYSPITSCHQIANDYELPSDANYWLQHDLEFLAACAKLYVLTLAGWENSIGVRYEIEFATEHNIPIEYISLEDFRGTDNKHGDA